MKKVAVVNLVLAFLILLAVPTVMAHGPSEAAQENNPLLADSTPFGAAMENPSGTRIGWPEGPGTRGVRINHWIDARMAFGIENNAIVLDTEAQVRDLRTNPRNYENQWIFLTYNAYFLYHRLAGYPEDRARAMADERPEGIYLHTVYLHE